MRNLRPLLFTTALLLSFAGAPAMHAGHYADLYVIPVASHTPGANGTNWQSDIAIHNFQSSTLTLELVLIESGASTLDNIVPLETITPVTVPPNGSRILNDVLADLSRPSSNIGSIIIGGDQPFAVTSRSYSMTPDGDTIGQTVVPARDFLTQAIGETASMATAYLPGLISNDRFRSNIGFTAGAGTGEPLVLEVMITGADGAQLGSERFTIAPGMFMHQQFSTRRFTSAAYDAGAAQLRIVSGNGAVVPYASVIDNNTADAVFVSGSFPANTGFATSSLPSVFEQLLRRSSTRW